jgi:hypothetical protein
MRNEGKVVHTIGTMDINLEQQLRRLNTTKLILLESQAQKLGILISILPEWR